jgi:DNA-binding NarL/FixJ family response regulator
VTPPIRSSKSDLLWRRSDPGGVASGRGRSSERPGLRPLAALPLAALPQNAPPVVGDRLERVDSEPGFPPTHTRVVIAGGQRLTRGGLRILLEADGHIRVASEASDAVEAVALAHRIRPDVILIDGRLPDLDCVALASRIVTEAGVAVLLLTASDADEHIFAALRAGVSGLLLQDAEPGELVRAVDTLARGGALLSPTLTRRLIAELTDRSEFASPRPGVLDELTAREREVVALVAHGLDNRQIAARLVVSPATAKTHVSRAMVKLHARDRAALVALAYKARLVVPPPPGPAL